MQKLRARGDDDMIKTLHEMIEKDLLVSSFVWTQLTLKLLRFPSVLICIVNIFFTYPKIYVLTVYTYVLTR